MYMFSNEPRCRYGAHQLAEVICQLRFPEILAISEKAPVDFQEAIREDFPQFIKRMERPAPTLTGTPGAMTLQNQPATVNYQFSSADGVWRVNLTGKFIRPKLIAILLIHESHGSKLCFVGLEFILRIKILQKCSLVIDLIKHVTVSVLHIDRIECCARLNSEYAEQ